MTKSIIAVGVLLVATLWSAPAAPWASANRYGGSTTHSAGETSHTNAYGGSTSHAYGEGTEHTNAYGGSTAHGWGGGTEHTNVYGGTTYGAYGAGAVHQYPSGATAYHPPGYPAYTAYPAYHPPVAVSYYSATSCNGCGVAAGAVVGMAAGAAVANANNQAAASNAYAAGVAAGSAGAGTYTMGVNYAALPSGCISPNVQGQSYYLCGNTWFRPAYGANGVFYTVVPAP